MTTIVTFPAPRPGRPASAGPDGGARILFFTGVRYVRDEDSTPAPSPDMGVIQVDGRSHQMSELPEEICA